MEPHQVKVRGQRIELEEVESVLKSCSGSRRAAGACACPGGMLPVLMKKGGLVRKDDG